MFQSSVPFGSPTFGPAISGLPNLTATGIDQSSAYQISAADSIFTNVAPGTGCRLPEPSNQPYTIYNYANYFLMIYPGFSDKIGEVLPNQPLLLFPGASITLSSFASALTIRPRLWYPIAGSIGSGGTSFLGIDTPGVFLNSQMNQPFVFEVGTGIDLTAQYQDVQGPIDGVPSCSTDALVGAVSTPAMSDVPGPEIHGANAVAAYAISFCGDGGPPNVGETCAFYGQFVSMADGAAGWGLNTVTDDNGHTGTYQGYECDLNSTSASSTVSGVAVDTNFAYDNVGTFAFVTLANGRPMVVAFSSQNGAATIAFQAGALTKTANSNSQPLSFTCNDATNTTRIGTIQGLAMPAGMSIFISGEGPGSNIQMGSPIAMDPTTSGAYILTGDNLTPTANFALAAGAELPNASSNSQAIGLTALDASTTRQQAVVQAIPVAAGASLFLRGSGAGATIQLGDPLLLNAYTIAAGASQLPAAAAGYEGAMAYVTDFNGSPTYRGAIGAGGGSTGTPVFCTGAAWLTC